MRKFLRCFINNKRGIARTIEAFFAAVLMLSSLAFIPAIQRNTQTANGVLSSKALDTMVSLDANGHLATLVDQRNWVAVKSCIESVLPTAIWFNLTVFNENMVPLNTVPISSGGVISDHIEAAEYLAASVSGTYAVYTIRLQLAGLD
jgi:hypothetical protein